MFPTLPSGLDNLAALGVVDFDPEAYVKGIPPRYAGAPRYYLPFEQPLPAFQPPVNLPTNVKHHEQPKHDEFKHESEEGIPLWKKLATGALVAGLVAFGIYKVKTLPKSAGEASRKFFDSTKNKVVETFNWVKGKMTSVKMPKTPATPVPPTP